MDIDWLKEAYRRIRKDGAAGVDGVTADDYEQDLEGNLQPIWQPFPARSAILDSQSCLFRLR
jgi:hypothetical protein